MAWTSSRCLRSPRGCRTTPGGWTRATRIRIRRSPSSLFETGAGIRRLTFDGVDLVALSPIAAWMPNDTWRLDARYTYSNSSFAELALRDRRGHPAADVRWRGPRRAVSDRRVDAERHLAAGRALHVFEFVVRRARSSRPARASGG